MRRWFRSCDPASRHGTVAGSRGTGTHVRACRDGTTLSELHGCRRATGAGHRPRVIPKWRNPWRAVCPRAGTRPSRCGTGRLPAPELLSDRGDAAARTGRTAVRPRSWSPEMTDRCESARLSAVLLMDGLSQTRDRLGAIGEDRELDQVEIVAVIDRFIHDSGELRTDFPGVHFVEVDPGTSRIQRRRAGFAAASGDIVIFSDAGKRSITARLARLGRSASPSASAGETGTGAVSTPLHAMPANAPISGPQRSGPASAAGSPRRPTSAA
jgi:hypothetical protein